MRLSQKTCLRRKYRFFGLKRDMFLIGASAAFSVERCCAMLICRGIYRLSAGVSRDLFVPKDMTAMRSQARSAQKASGPAGTRHWRA